MKPDWDKLMANYAGSTAVGVYDVDCTAGGKALCEQAGVRGYPTILYGDPSDVTALTPYHGGRTLDTLYKFVKETLIDGNAAASAPSPKPTGEIDAKPTAKPAATKTTKSTAQPRQAKPNPKLPTAKSASKPASKGAKGGQGKRWPNTATPGKPKAIAKPPPVQAKRKAPSKSPRAALAASAQRMANARSALGAHDAASLAAARKAAKKAAARKAAPGAKAGQHANAIAGAYQKRHARNLAEAKRKTAQVAAKRQALHKEL